MRAAVVEKYGPPEVVHIQEVPTPVPGDHDVRIRVRATTVNSGDVRLRALNVPPGLGLAVRVLKGFFKPRQPILGCEVAGVVDAVGKEVRKYTPGERVVASPGLVCGAHAEYVVVPEGGAIAHIPDGIRDEDAVSVLFGGTTALAFFREGGLRAGHKILINGASGAVGTMAVQIARQMGAEVTAVCSAAHADLVRSLGAHRVIDYAQEDFTQGDETYDVIMDNHGNAPYAKVKGRLREGGRFLMVIFGNLGQLIAASTAKAVVNVTDETASINAENFAWLMGQLASGALEPVIDSVYPFEQIALAHRRVDSGHKAGSAVVTLAAAA